MSKCKPEMLPFLHLGLQVNYLGKIQTAFFDKTFIAFASEKNVSRCTK